MGPILERRLLQKFEFNLIMLGIKVGHLKSDNFINEIRFFESSSLFLTYKIVKGNPNCMIFEAPDRCHKENFN